MSNEKRKHERLPVIVEVEWEGGIRASGARTIDISEGGCFVDTCRYNGTSAYRGDN
ncbi:MAG: PilZ domain-containing protein [bacterium]